jgi:adenosylcobinamide kinase/adenosylcobinamide-phosphate guanylyltransferase
MVSNEVGTGIVPADPVSRKFRDMAGRMNQVMAGACTEVYFVVAGLHICMKHG